MLCQGLALRGFPFASDKLAEGFILGTARHFGESAAIDQPECMHRGDERCLIHCRFAAA